MIEGHVLPFCNLQKYVCSDLCLDTLKPVPRPSPSAEAVVEELSRPQADLAQCDEENEMDCFDDGTECVPFSQLCDGQRQCSNGEDENPETCAFYDGKLSVFCGVNCHPSHSLGMLAFLALPSFASMHIITLLRYV